MTEPPHDDDDDDGPPAASVEMTVSPSPAPPHAPTAADVPLISPVDTPSSPLVRIGGGFGILGMLLGFAVLLAGCAGFGKALVAAPISVGAGVLGLLLALIGALAHRRRIGEDTHVMQALFACLMSIAGGLIEMAIWLKWPILK